MEAAWPWVADFLNITQEQLAEGVAKALHLPVADLPGADASALAFLPRTQAERLGVFPLRVSDRELIVATSDPLDFEAEREIAFLSSRRTAFQIAPPEAVSKAREAAYTQSKTSARETIGGDQLAEAHKQVQLDPGFDGTIPYHPDSVIKVERLILYEASKRGAAEIHISPRGSVGLVQFNLNGQLTTFVRVPLKIMAGVHERLCILADLSGDAEEQHAGTVPLLIGGGKYMLMVRNDPSSSGHLVLTLERLGAPAPSAPEAAATWHPATTTNEGHILIVDDDAGGRMLMRTVLEKNGFEVSEADDGSSAIPFLQQAKDVDGILLDLKMKSMDGMEALKRIRSSMKTSALPVVILTGSSDPEDEERLLRAGADDYLRKPVDPLQLVTRIRSVLKRARL